MNKSDVLSIVENIALNPFFKNYVVRKSDASIILKSEVGYKRIQFQYYNSYDLKRDQLALEITPNYDIRFNVLHKWFEKYSKRTLKDQRDDYSVGFTGSMISGTDTFYFLESRNNYDEDFKILYNEVIKNAKYVFTKYATLESYYDRCINDVLQKKRDWPDIGIEWIMEYLIATKLIAPFNYKLIKDLILQRIEYMMSRNEPNTKMYYNDLPAILKDLEGTDFTSGKWGKLPISIAGTRLIEKSDFAQ